MCLISKKFRNKYLITIGFFAIFVINLTHAIYGFLIKVNYFNSSDLFDSSPLFDFSIGKTCPNKANVTFHKYGGRKDYEWTIGDDLWPTKKLVIVDQTDIRKINGNYFCYRHVSYKDLLHNGQIIKKGTECPSQYPKNCGILDTLEQELCIKNTENCPLYDLGFGEPTDSVNYIYNIDAKVYYNKDNYNKTNKKIIGRLILNEGQPCYNSTEKLWRQFSSEEGFKTHLKCEFEVFGKYNDDRYEERGSISYERIYYDNLNKECQNLVMNQLTGIEKVHLYKREFYGLDKECDKKYNLNENTYNTIHDSEQSEYYLLIVEGIFACTFSFIYVMLESFRFCNSSSYDDEDDDDIISKKVHCSMYTIYILFLFCCFICHIVYYSRLAENDLTGYNCSDAITNEILRKGFEDSIKNIYSIKVNFYLELVLFLGNIIIMIIICIWEVIENCCPIEFEKKNEETSNNEKSETNTAQIPLNNYYPNPS